MSRSQKIRVLAALGSLSGLAWAGTFATFTDDATAASTFSSGTVNLELADTANDAYAFTTLSASNLKPGDVKFSTLKVENAGSLSSSWTMDSSESESLLSGEVKLAAVTGAVTCDETGYAAASLLPTNRVIANGSLSAAAVTTPRTLAPEASETLCFRVELPGTAGNTFQGLTTTSTFTFTLTQS